LTAKPATAFPEIVCITIILSWVALSWVMFLLVTFLWIVWTCCFFRWYSYGKSAVCEKYQIKFSKKCGIFSYSSCVAWSWFNAFSTQLQAHLDNKNNNVWKRSEAGARAWAMKKRAAELEPEPFSWKPRAPELDPEVRSWKEELLSRIRSCVIFTTAPQPWNPWLVLSWLFNAIARVWSLIKIRELITDKWTDFN